MVAGHVSKLSEGRSILTRALEADLAKLAESRSGIDGLVAGQVEKLAQGRDILTRALEADLRKLAESRAGIDGLVAGQVEKLAQGRDILTRALEADLKTLGESRAVDRRGGRPAMSASSPTDATCWRARSTRTCGKLLETRSQLDDVVQGHAKALADRRNEISEAAGRPMSARSRMPSAARRA